MEGRTETIHSRLDRKLGMEITPGHFVTNHSHINYYVDMTDLKTDHSMAAGAAQVLAQMYAMTPVDAILCLEGTQVVGAFLAQALAKGVRAVNGGESIRVLTPEVDESGQMLFRDNTRRYVGGKNVLLLLASASTGKTISQSMECLAYYRGRLAGVAALFSAAERIAGTEIRAIFTGEDLPDYRTYPSGECRMCREKQRVDAIVNTFGYSEL